MVVFALLQFSNTWTHAISPSSVLIPCRFRLCSKLRLFSFRYTPESSSPAPLLWTTKVGHANAANLRCTRGVGPACSSGPRCLGGLRSIQSFACTTVPAEPLPHQRHCIWSTREGGQSVPPTELGELASCRITQAHQYVVLRPAAPQFEFTRSRNPSVLVKSS